ncbi:MAG: hypothetical protein JXQ73_23315 [Phycisphaerae bacterium]|nr:hypothetical protein [Phycisphaerae bacterium]
MKTTALPKVLPTRLLLATLTLVTALGQGCCTAPVAPGDSNVPSDAIAIRFVNKNSNYTSSTIWLFFTGPVTGNINTESGGTGEALQTNTSYTLEDLRYGITVTNIGGRIYISLGDQLPTTPAPAYDFKAALTSVDMRWSFVELTYSTGIVSVVNLSDVDFYAFPISLYACDGTSLVPPALTYSASGDTVQSQLTNLIPAAQQASAIKTKTIPNTQTTALVRILSPVHAPQAYPSLQPYVDYVQAQASGAVFATIEDQYSRFGTAGQQCSTCTTTTTADPYALGTQPPTDADHACRYSTQTYSFECTFNGSGDIEMVGGGSCIGETGYTIMIPASEIAYGIYTGIPAYTVNGHEAPGGTFDTNDLFNAAVRDLMAGFAFGFVGSTQYGSLVSNQWWSATQVFSDIQPVTNGNYFYNAYAEIIYNNSNAYGQPYSDRWQPVQAHIKGGDTVQIVFEPDATAPSNTPCAVSP